MDDKQQFVEHVKDILRYQKSSLLSLPEEIRNDANSILEIARFCSTQHDLENYYQYVGYVSTSLLEDKLFLKKLLSIQPQAFRVLPDYLSNDEDVCDYAVQLQPENFRYINKRLKNTVSFVKKHIGSFPFGAVHCGENIRSNREIAMIAVKSHGNSLQYFYEDIQDDEDVAKLAVKSQGTALEFCSERIKNNKEIVQIALGSAPELLRYVSEELKNDYETVLIAAKKNLAVLEFVTPDMREQICDNNVEIIAQNIKYVPENLRYVNEHIKDKEDIVFSAVLKSPEILRHASDRLRSDPSFLLKILRIKPNAVSGVSKNLLSEAGLKIDHNSYALDVITLIQFLSKVELKEQLEGKLDKIHSAPEHKKNKI